MCGAGAYAPSPELCHLPQSFKPAQLTTSATPFHAQTSTETSPTVGDGGGQLCAGRGPTRRPRNSAISPSLPTILQTGLPPSTKTNLPPQPHQHPHLSPPIFVFFNPTPIPLQNPCKNPKHHVHLFSEPSTPIRPSLQGRASPVLPHPYIHTKPRSPIPNRSGEAADAP